MVTNQAINRPPSPNELLEPRLITDGFTVRVVGVGGIGGNVCRQLAIFLASLPHETNLVCIDGDAYEPKNASRMLFGTYGNKAAVIRADLLGYFSNSTLSITAIDESISPENINELLPGGVDEVTILCVDNHPARKLVNDYYEGTDGVPGIRDACLISGGNDGVGTDSSGLARRGSYGNVQIYLRRNGEALSPSLTAFHDEIATASQVATSPHCTDVIDTTPQLLFTNVTAAAAICNTFWLYVCGALHYSELSFDIVNGTMRPLGIPAPKEATQPC